MSTYYKDLINDMTKEFIETNGGVSCEFACHYSKLGPVIKTIKDVCEELYDKTLSSWVLRVCRTCEKQHGEGYLHIAIERVY